jgi:hypothetical protein
MRKLGKISVIAAIAAMAVITPSCGPQKQIAGAYTYATECMGVELDGSETMKAWGKGKDRNDAVEQAKKNAVRDVLFVGIRNGKTECDVKPVLNEVNAQQKYEDYFNKFFTDGGAYKNFVSMKDESLFPAIAKDRKGDGSEVEYGVIVRVLRSELKKQMIADKILPTI